MTVSPQDERRAMVTRSKYEGLYAYLCSLQALEWRASFSEIEAIVGFSLPPSARLYREWWANQLKGSSYRQSLAWNVAGWETAEVDVVAETLLFPRMHLSPP